MYCSGISQAGAVNCAARRRIGTHTYLPTLPLPCPPARDCTSPAVASSQSPGMECFRQPAAAANSSLRGRAAGQQRVDQAGGEGVAGADAVDDRQDVVGPAAVDPAGAAAGGAGVQQDGGEPVVAGREAARNVMATSENPNRSRNCRATCS